MFRKHPLYPWVVGVTLLLACLVLVWTITDEDDHPIAQTVAILIWLTIGRQPVLAVFSRIVGWAIFGDQDS